MHFWNTKLLAQDLGSAKVSPKEKQKYFFYLVGVLLLITAAFVTHILYTNSVAAILSLLLLGIGTFVAAKKNQSRDGKDFSLRALCLTPLLLLKVIVGAAIFFVAAKQFFPEVSQTSWFLIPSWLAFTLIYLKWLLAQITALSKPKVSWEAHQGI